MAKQLLPTNFVDDILASSMGGKRKFTITDNGDGTYEIEDVTDYTQTGSDFGSGQINATNQAVNESCDKANVIETMDDIVANKASGMIAGAKAVAELNDNLYPSPTLLLPRNLTASDIGKTIVLNDNLSNYKYIEIRYTFNAYGHYIHSEKMPISTLDGWSDESTIYNQVVNPLLNTQYIVFCFVNPKSIYIRPETIDCTWKISSIYGWKY